MIGDEGPEQGIPDFRPRAFFLIGHLEDVVGTGNVGLGGERPAIGELRHAVNVRHHDPVIGIDEKLGEPAIHLMGIETAQQHEISQHHESLDVMAIRLIMKLADDAVDGRDAGGGVVKGFGDATGVMKEIEISNLRAAMAVDAIHEFPPADDLTDETF